MAQLIHKNRWLQVIIWLVMLIVLLLNVLALEPDANREDVGELLFTLILLWLSIMAASYTALYLHTLLFKQQRYILFGLALPFSLTGIVLCFRAVADLLLDVSFMQSFYSDIVSFSLVMGIAIGMRYAKQGLLGRYQLKEMQAQLLKAELQTLKSQINPHFLFNTLNNIYGVNLRNPEKGSEMILNLSEMFRYFLDAQKKERVSLEEELELIQNYIGLERMRLTPSNRIELTIHSQATSCLLPPLLLMPLVENAVKYGINPGKEVVVTIGIHHHEKELTLTTENDIHPGHQAASTHTGLKNLRERLDRLYPGRHTLYSAAKDSRWHSKLVISL